MRSDDILMMTTMLNWLMADASDSTSREHWTNLTPKNSSTA